jgi:hypothetical protein
VVENTGSLVAVAEVYTIPHLHLVKVEVRVDLMLEEEMVVTMTQIPDVKTLVVEEVDQKGILLLIIKAVPVVPVSFSSHILPN